MWNIKWGNVLFFDNSVFHWSERIHQISYLCQIITKYSHKDDKLSENLWFLGYLYHHIRRNVWCHVCDKLTHVQRKWESVVEYSASQRPQNFYQWPSGLHKWKEVRLMTNIESQALVGSGWHRLACKLHRRMDKGSAPFWQLRKTSWIFFIFHKLDSSPALLLLTFCSMKPELMLEYKEQYNVNVFFYDFSAKHCQYLGGGWGGTG